MNNPSRVLLADDEDLFRETTADLLRNRATPSMPAGNAGEAARMLTTEHYDVLISDIKMPGNAELELCWKSTNWPAGCRLFW